MRIAQVSPLYESVPPKQYGGTERVVSYLTEELVRMGHEVTLFASGDSQTTARLIAACPRSLWSCSEAKLENERRGDAMAHHLRLLEMVFHDTSRFDVIHFHCEHLHYPFLRRQPCPSVTTLHGELSADDHRPLFEEYRDVPLVSISDDQRLPVPQANWQTTVYHGLPRDLYTFRGKPGAYLAFLGRVAPEKGVDQAILMACRAGKKLKIAAAVQPEGRAYFQETIEPLLHESRSLVEFIGEVGGRDKDEFLSHAEALLFPISWHEPFGLVMVEALACGTPVIAYRQGSVPEVIDDGKSGFIVDDIDGAVQAIARLGELSRPTCRRIFEERFDAARMARDYVEVYRRVSGRHREAIPRPSRSQAQPGNEPRTKSPANPEDLLPQGRVP